MKNIHVLPTNKPSRVFNTNKGEYHFREHYVPDTIQTCKNHNIYITSDEEIKDGDWVLNISNDKIFKQDNSKPDTYTLSFWRKIILTTDPILIADGVQAIDDEFLEWFVKNPSCDFAHVLKNPFHEPTIYRYKIIIPQEQMNPTPTENPPIKNGDVYDMGQTVNGVSRFLFFNEKWYYFEERLSRECRKDKSELTKLVNDTENDFNEVKYIGNIFSLNLSENK